MENLEELKIIAEDVAMELFRIGNLHKIDKPAFAKRCHLKAARLLKVLKP